MLLTLTTMHSPATDLGYLLHKRPERDQSNAHPRDYEKQRQLTSERYRRENRRCCPGNPANACCGAPRGIALD